MVVALATHSRRGRTDLRQLTYGSDGSISVLPVWSPDGRMLLFTRITAADAGLWTMAADGAKQTKIVDLSRSDSSGNYDWGRAP